MWSSVEWNGCGEAGSAPCSRGKHSATLLDGYVYILGGRGAGGSVPLRDFWRYCLATGEWERLELKGDPPPALQEHSATAHESRLYVFGGEAGSHSSETPLWIYDTETQLWRKLPGQNTFKGGTRRYGADARAGTVATSPRGRRGHSAHTLKDCLLVYGGYKDLRGSTNELWAFHYETETWHQVRTANPGPARHRHAAALHDNRLYVHGGQCDLRACADLWHYDTMSRAWTQVRSGSAGGARWPGARCGHAGLRAGAHLYVFGGQLAELGAPCNELWRYHFETETWERIPQGALWPAPRVDACALLAAATVAGAGAAPLVRARPAGGPRPTAGPRGRRRAARGSYSVLAADTDSTESLLRHEAALASSRSAHMLAHVLARPGGGRLARGPASEPELAELAALATLADDVDVDVDGDGDTSDYASAERVGFSNPHYLGPDVRALAALTPDSGVPDSAHDIELQPLGGAPRLTLLLLGGREPPHRARLQSPLSMWSFRLL